MTLTILRPLTTGRLAQVHTIRRLSAASARLAEGDTGSMRSGGERSGDTWNRREKAAENLYIRGREKAILQLLKEKIAKQEEALIKDRAMLSAMEDEYGKIAEERAHV